MGSWDLEGTVELAGVWDLFRQQLLNTYHMPRREDGGARREEPADFVEVRQAGVCQGRVEFGESIQGLNIWALRWKLMTSGQLDALWLCYLGKGCYLRRENGGAYVGE